MNIGQMSVSDYREIHAKREGTNELKLVHGNLFTSVLEKEDVKNPLEYVTNKDITVIKY
jgi:hypothetical protein